MIFTSNTIKCLAQLAPKKELRHYLNGAYFNLANKTIEITDGMWCVVIHGAILGGPDSDTPRGVFIPHDVLTQAAKLDDEWFVLDVSPDGTATLNGIDIPELDGAFPDVRRVEADAKRELDGACSLGRLSLDIVNHVNKALKPLGKSLSITPCVSTTWDYRKPVAFEIHGTAYRINLYVSLWVM